MVSSQCFHLAETSSLYGFEGAAATHQLFLCIEPRGCLKAKTILQLVQLLHFVQPSISLISRWISKLLYPCLCLCTSMTHSTIHNTHHALIKWLYSIANAYYLPAHLHYDYGSFYGPSGAIEEAQNTLCCENGHGWQTGWEMNKSHSS